MLLYHAVTDLINWSQLTMICSLFQHLEIKQNVDCKGQYNEPSAFKQ